MSDLRGLSVAGLFTPPSSKNTTIVSIPWYYQSGDIPANFRSPFNPNPTLDALKNMVAPVIVIG